MPFAFAVAVTHYEQRLHPRLLCDEGDLDRIRRQVRDGTGLRLMESMRRKIAPAVEQVLATREVSDLLMHHTVSKMASQASAFLVDMAMVAALDGGGPALEAARRVLAALPEAERRGPDDTYNSAYAHLGDFALAYDLLHPHLSAEERRGFNQWLAKRSVLDVVDTLHRDHYLRATGFNKTMVGLISAVTALLAIEGDEGVPDLSAAKRQLLVWFEATLYGVVGPEGYPAEDVGYGTGMVCYFSRSVEAVRRAGIYDAYRECPRWNRFGRALLHFTQPWGKVTSNTGDYGADVGPTSLVLPRLATETRDPAMLWLHGTLSYPLAASGPHDGSTRRLHWPELMVRDGFRLPVDAYTMLVLDDLAAPAVHPHEVGGPTAFMDADRGIVSLRDSWRPEATFVVFDGSHRTPLAPGHAHDSGGHFSLSAMGEYFAIDTGRYNIEQEHHNVVLVDGKSGHVGDGRWISSDYRALLTGFHPGPFVDAASVDSSQMSDCFWAKRTLGLVKGPEVPGYVFTVDDVNKDNNFHEFWWVLNVHPDSRIRIEGEQATVEGAYHGNLLDIHFGMLGPTEYAKPFSLKLEQRVQLAGSPKEYGGDPAATAKAYREKMGLLEFGPVFERPRLDARVFGASGRFMSLLLPRLKGKPPAKVTRLPSGQGVLAMRVNFGHVEDTIVWAYEHPMLEADDVVARGNWCVVRRDMATRRVLRHALHGGDRLTVEGVRLCPEPGQ
ncbi:MAG: heparinase II/III family protein [Planctomycetota bacterium]|nr:heparinase II/III family protein [Planctomycetota bacterium]